MNAPARRLAANEFIGRIDARQSFPGAEIAFIGNVAEVEPHEHEEGHLVLILEGFYATSARGADAPIGAGAAIINPAGTRHRDAFAAPGVLMTLTPSAAVARWIEPDEQGERIASPQAAACLRAIACEARAPDALSALTVEAACLEAYAQARAPAAAPSWLAKARARLDDAPEDTSVEELARECGVHPIYFARAFRAHVGSSPGSYRRRRRAMRAAALLVRTKAALADIALACGFADQPAFTKCFTRVAGMAPAAFRRVWTG